MSEGESSRDQLGMLSPESLSSRDKMFRGGSSRADLVAYAKKFKAVVATLKAATDAMDIFVERQTERSLFGLVIYSLSGSLYTRRASL